MSKPNFQVGDKTRKASRFLRNTGQYFDDGTHGWGRVIEVAQSGDLQIVTVQWMNTITEKVITEKLINPNLEKKRQP